MFKKVLSGVAGLAMAGLTGCEVYAPAPGVVIGPAPVVVGVGPYYHHYGYYGYYGWRHGYWRR